MNIMYGFIVGYLCGIICNYEVMEIFEKVENYAKYYCGKFCDTINNFNDELKCQIVKYQNFSEYIELSNEELKMIKDNYPNKIPVFVQYLEKNNNLFEKSNKKWLVSRETKTKEFLFDLKSRLSLQNNLDINKIKIIGKKAIKNFDNMEQLYKSVSKKDRVIRIKIFYDDLKFFDHLLLYI
jgi:hypothetical protein